MTERYGKCPVCRGWGHVIRDTKTITDEETSDECGRCMGTGFDGSAITYMQRQANEDWERERSQDSQWSIFR